MWNLLTGAQMDKCKPESLIWTLHSNSSKNKPNHNLMTHMTAGLTSTQSRCFFYSKYSKNSSKYKANTLGNVCYCSPKAHSSEGHNKLHQQDQMAVVVGLKQMETCVCDCQSQSMVWNVGSNTCLLAKVCSCVCVCGKLAAGSSKSRVECRWMPTIVFF